MVQTVVASSAARVAGLDTKASLLLVIAGVITAANFDGDALLLRMAVIMSGLSALMAVVSLWPRRVKGISAEVLIKRLETHSDTPYEFNIYLLGLERAASIAREKSLRRRGWWLIVGFVLAAISLFCVVTSVVGEKDWFAEWFADTIASLLSSGESAQPEAPADRKD